MQWLLIVPYMVLVAFAMIHDSGVDMSKGVGLFLWLGSSGILFVTGSINTLLTHRIFGYDCVHTVSGMDAILGGDKDSGPSLKA
jgi:hypothetical protein